MIHLPFAVVKAWKIAAGLFGIGLMLMAAGEATSNRDLLLVSIITSGTSLLGVIISGAISLHNAKKLTLVADLPGKVDEFRKEVDGRMTELSQSRLETSAAKQDVARAEGVQQERTEERDRQSASETTPRTNGTPS